jgi:recombinational DNA repair protein (RecF pathway)
MRHKYSTTGFVLSRSPLGEASASICLLTPDLGIVYARAQSVRKPGAKLAPALQTFTEADVILVRGKEGWRLSGAVLADDWFSRLGAPARTRAGRITSLLQRLVHGDARETPFYTLITDFLAALALSIQDDVFADAAEILVALRILHALGVDAGALPGGENGGYSEEILKEILDARADYILRINRGITASGL